METKNLKTLVIILAVGLGVSGVGNIILGTMLAEPGAGFDNTLIYAEKYGPYSLDIQDMWELAGWNIASQVFEGLYRYDLGDPDLPLIPQLAAEIGEWELAAVDPENSIANVTIPLREDVVFHDGTKFNASAVKWSFDRLAYQMNHTGLLPDTLYPALPHSLFEWPDGTPVINRTEIVDTYTIKFVMNKPFGVFEGILTFNAAMIMSPTSSMFDTRVEMAQACGPDGTGHKLVGTGPWVFESYTAGVETRMHRNDDYYLGPAAIENLVISIIEDSDARNNAMLAGDVDLLAEPHPSFYDEMRDSDDVYLYEGPADAITQYLGMNNRVINQTWRQAISYAIDYDYMIAELLEGEAERLQSPIPKGIAYSNYSSNHATFNKTKARMLVQSMGFGGALGLGDAADTAWKAEEFMVTNYTYNFGDKFREDFLVLLQDNLDNIGITLEDNGQEWGPYLDLIYYNVDKLGVWFIGWVPDYNDPSDYVYTLMSDTGWNEAQINDTYLENLLRASRAEINSTIRKQQFDEIQRYCCEELMPWAWGYSLKNKDAFAPNLKGFESNAIGYVYFYPCYYTAT